MASRISSIIKNLLKKRKVLLFMLISFFAIIIVLSIKNTYAYYYESITSLVLANKVGDFDLGEGDVNILIYKETEEGNFSRTYSIPSSYYQFNDGLTSCSVPCNDGLGNCEYSYDSTKKTFTVTSNQELTCKFYFEKTENSDLNVYVLIEDENGTYQNGNKYYSISNNIPAYGYVYTGAYTCDGNATLTYNSVTRKFNVEAKTNSNCYAYFDSVKDIDVSVNVYVQSESNSEVYNKVDSIPSNAIYILNDSKSYCINSEGQSTGALISYTEGYINITTSEQQSCEIYLDLESN